MQMDNSVLYFILKVQKSFFILVSLEQKISCQKAWISALTSSILDDINPSILEESSSLDRVKIEEENVFSEIIWNRAP